MNQNGSFVTSFDEADLSEFKRYISGQKPYHARLSLALTIRLAICNLEHMDTFNVLDEIDYLEGIKPSSRTKKPARFRKPPLQNLWHKHFFSTRHLVKNVGVRWNLADGGNADFSAMIESVEKDFGDNPDLWQKVLAHRLVIEGFSERACRGLTGDWIVYGVHEGKNFYLDVAKHEEGRQPEHLLRNLRSGCYAEFPFLFE